MQWTTERPTQPGHYWVRAGYWGMNGFEYHTLCVKVKRDDWGDGDFDIRFPHTDDFFDEDKVTHWMGPVDEPAPPVGED